MNKRVKETVTNPDALYRPFPPFADWAKSTVDTTRWDRYSTLLASRGEISPEDLRKARDVVKRAAAIDTGAIEGLYDVDRGFTFTVATQSALWEVALESKGPKTRALIESQLQAYEYVLDAATQNTPISEAWLRTLHAELCQAQETYSVMTEVGPQVHALPLGKYKHLPNHVLTADGELHSYAPVDLTPAEMHRLMEELRSPAFLAAHPVLQASYAHYALTVIHPFADGNGRVARALGSVFTYRSHSIPLLVLVENREEYYATLKAADDGDRQPFVDFILERCLDAILLVSESLRAAMMPQPQTALADLKNLYVTKGGYSQEEVDKAGNHLLSLFQQEFSRQTTELTLEGRLSARVAATTSYADRSPKTHRRLTQENNALSVSLISAPPAPFRAELDLAVLVPKDAGREDDIVLQRVENAEAEFAARVSELIPRTTAALQMRIAVAVQRMLGQQLAKLVSEASKHVR